MADKGNPLREMVKPDSPVGDYIRQRASEETMGGLLNTLLGTGMMSGGIGLSGAGVSGIAAIPLAAYGGKTLADGLMQQWNGMKLSGAAPMWDQTGMPGRPLSPEEQAMQMQLYQQMLKQSQGAMPPQGE